MYLRQSFTNPDESTWDFRVTNYRVAESPILQALFGQIENLLSFVFFASQGGGGEGLV